MGERIPIPVIARIIVPLALAGCAEHGPGTLQDPERPASPRALQRGGFVVVFPDDDGASPAGDGGLSALAVPLWDAGTSDPGDEGNGGFGPLQNDGDGGVGPPGATSGAPGEEDDCGDATEREVIRLTNEERQARGIPLLACDPGVARAARLHSEDMCAQGYFSHTSRDGRSLGDRLREQGVASRGGGENIAHRQRTPPEVMRAWMNSSGHRANILSTRHGRIGVGYEACGGRAYWTQDFVR